MNIYSAGMWRTCGVYRVALKIDRAIGIRWLLRGRIKAQTLALYLECKVVRASAFVNGRWGGERYLVERRVVFGREINPHYRRPSLGDVRTLRYFFPPDAPPRDRRRRPSIRSSKARRELQTRERYTARGRSCNEHSEATVSHAVWHLTPTNAPPVAAAWCIQRFSDERLAHSTKLTPTDHIFLPWILWLWSFGGIIPAETLVLFLSYERLKLERSRKLNFDAASE